MGCSVQRRMRWTSARQPSSPLFSDAAQAVLTQFASEPEDLRFDGRGRRIEFAHQGRVHVAKGATVRNQIPDARADAVQSEVQPAFQVEQHALAAQFADDDLVAERQAIVDGWRVHVAAARSVYCI